MVTVRDLTFEICTLEVRIPSNSTHLGSNLFRTWVMNDSSNYLSTKVHTTKQYQKENVTSSIIKGIFWKEVDTIKLIHLGGKTVRMNSRSVNISLLVCRVFSMNLGIPRNSITRV